MLLKPSSDNVENIVKNRVYEIYYYILVRSVNRGPQVYKRSDNGIVFEA